MRPNKGQTPSKYPQMSSSYPITSQSILEVYVWKYTNTTLIRISAFKHKADPKTTIKVVYKNLQK